jgi:polygalacturonase
MSALSIQVPFPVFQDRDGQPLDNGYVWIGTANLNPQTNPVVAYFDAALTIVAAQPLRTLNGYISRAGTPAQVYVDGNNFSILVQDSKGSMVYSFPQGTGIEPVPNNASGIVYDPAGTGAVATNVQTKLRESVSVKDFGAVGDGVTNDTTAFQLASNYINAQDGGKLIIPPGTYIVGKQDFAGAFGLGYAYRPQQIIYIQGCTRPVVIESQGAKLRLADGLKFGSFNPVTGAVYNTPVTPLLDPDYKGQTGIMIQFYQNANVTLTGGIELDGNIANQIVGGSWGDAGRQLIDYGVWAYNNDICNINNVWSHHHCLDGMASGYDGLITEAGVMKPLTLINCVFENNARQGWSMTGGRGVTAIGCKFNNTGKDIPFTSAPGAGCDIEAEGGWIRDVTFIDCEFSNNTGVGLIAGSGDTAGVTAIRCRFIGTTSWSIWPQKPRIAFHDCLIVGSAVNAFSSATQPDDATKFFNCKFSDEVAYSPTGAVYDGGYLAIFAGSQNIVFEKCNFTATVQRNLYVNGGFVRNCTFVCKAPLINQDYIAIIWDATIENLTILDQIATPSVDGYYVNFSSTKYKGTNFISGSKIKWWSWSAGAGGASGYLGQSDPDELASPYLSVIKGSGSAFLGYYGTADTYWGTAAPVAGTYKRGDRFFNSSPTVGQPKSWVCTVAGTPGTWVSEGNL